MWLVVTNLQRVLTNSAAYLSSTELFSLFQLIVFCFFRSRFLLLWFTLTTLITKNRQS